MLGGALEARRVLGAASTPCLGRMATWIIPNSGSPRAWASAPCSGGGTRSQRSRPASPQLFDQKKNILGNSESAMNPANYYLALS